MKKQTLKKLMAIILSAAMAFSPTVTYATENSQEESAEAYEYDSEEENPDQEEYDSGSENEAEGETEEYADDNTDTTVVNPVISNIKNEADAEEYAAENNLVILDSMDLSVPEGTDFPVQITFPAITGDGDIGIRHYLEDKKVWEEIIPDEIGDGIITATFNSLSPVIIVRDMTDEEINQANEDTFEEQELVVEKDGFKITAKGIMPVGSVLVADKITYTENLENIVNEDTADEVSFVIYDAFDIKILNKNGAVYQPMDQGKTITITVTGIEINTEEEIEVHRISENEEVEIMDSEVVDEKTVEFETEHFTTFTISGKTYTVSDDWYENWTYEVDYEKQLIYLSTYGYKNSQRIESAPTDVVIPSSALIKGKRYQTILACAEGERSHYIVAGEGYTFSYKTEDGNTAFEYLYHSPFHGNFRITSVVVQTGVILLNGSAYQLFEGCSNLQTVELGGLFDSEGGHKIKTSRYMFSDCEKLSSIDLSSFDFSECTDMYSMFEGASALQNLNLGENFDTRNVTHMHSMFSGCKKLKNLDLGNKFDTGNVISMDDMFNGCKSLVTLSLGEKFDTKNAETIGYMFNGCTRLEELDLGNKFSLTGMTVSSTLDYVFEDCGKLRKLKTPSAYGTLSLQLPHILYEAKEGGLVDKTKGYDLLRDTSPASTWLYKPVTVNFKDENNKELFVNDDVIYGSDITNLHEGEWYTDNTLSTRADLSNVTKDITVFCIADTTWQEDWTGLRGLKPDFSDHCIGGDYDYELDEDNRTITIHAYKGDDVDVIIPAYAIVGGVRYRTIFDAEPVNTQKLRSVSTGSGTEYAFETWWEGAFFLVKKYIKSITIDPDVEIIGLRRAFYGCDVLASVNAGDWDISRVTRLDSTFEGCLKINNLDVSGWNVSNVTNMNSAFNRCYALESLDVSRWNTGNVTDMAWMFAICESLKHLDVSRWDTSKAQINNMFYHCENLEEIDVSNWNTGSSTAMSSVFVGCSKLKDIDVSGWNTDKVTTVMDMFKGTAISKLDLENWNVSEVVNTTGFLANTHLTSLRTPAIMGDKTLPLNGAMYRIKNDDVLDKDTPYSAIDPSITGNTWLYVGNTVTFKDDAENELFSDYIKINGDASMVHLGQWFSDKAMTEPADLTEITEDTVVYGRGAYIVRYNANNGTTNYFQSVVGLNEDHFVATAPYKKGDLFVVGWNTQADGMGDPYTIGQNVSNLTGADETFELFAVYGAETPFKGSYVVAVPASLSMEYNPGTKRIKDRKSISVMGTFEDDDYVDVTVSDFQLENSLNTTKLPIATSLSKTRWTKDNLDDEGTLVVESKNAVNTNVGSWHGNIKVVIKSGNTYVP